jgi:hypothetical protein
MANKSIHITTHGDDWQVKTTRNTKATKVCTTQKECIDYGKKQAQRHDVELFIHEKNGQIRKKNSYGNDPRNIKG